MLLNPAENAMAALGALLQDHGYSFTTITPQSHLRVLNRAPHDGPYREAFGWNRAFQKSQLPAQIVQLLQTADAIEDDAGVLRSRIRFSSLDGLLFCHSAFPTVSEDAVFFGPDSYRFATVVGRFVRALQRESILSVVDMGCGSGVGGIYLAKRLGLPTACKICLADISETALSMSRVNIAINGAAGVDVQHSDVLASFPKNLDLIISNPPYLADPQRRLYRDGGGEFGMDLSLRIVEEAIEHLGPGGCLVLYTGTFVVDGVDLFKNALSRFASPSLLTSYEELDPDVFGEELSSPPYDQADRIAVVSLIVQKNRSRPMSNSAWVSLASDLEGPSFELVQKTIARRNAEMLELKTTEVDWRTNLDRDLAVYQAEGEYVAAVRTQIQPWLRDLPTDADSFIAWFEALKDRGPGQNDPLFPWLEGSCSLAQMKWFLTQEVAGEAGFEDLLAMTQVKMSVQPKLEMARNYWDEMGRGQEKGMRGGLLHRLSDHLKINPVVETIVPEALALGNAMVALARNRRYAYHSVGALGVIEMTAPARADHVNKALKRLRVPARKRLYFAVHAVLDVKHSEEWNREVIRPLVAEDPARASAIAEGALIRLWHGERCFARYRREFSLSEMTHGVAA